MWLSKLFKSSGQVKSPFLGNNNISTDEVMKIYDVFHAVLQTLGSFSPSHEVSLDDVDMPRKLLSSAYNTYRETDFDGSMIDYLCLISTQYLVRISRAETAADFVRFVANNLPRYREDVKNMLRLLLKNHDYLFSALSAPPDKGAFCQLAGIWFDIYREEFN